MKPRDSEIQNKNANSEDMIVNFPSEEILIPVPKKDSIDTEMKPFPLSSKLKQQFLLFGDGDK
jgi:hypothetical protein